MSYKQQAAELKEKAQARLGEKFRIVTGDMDRVRTSGVLDHALKLNETAPDFTLPDAFGHDVSLRDLLAKGPVVISFYRGEWCPYCNLELRAFQEVLPRMQALGASLVAISPEKPDGAMAATEKNNLTFTVLSDLHNVVARQFGVVFQIGEPLKDLSKNVFKNDLALRNLDDSYELPVPATFVLDAAGTVRFAHVEVDYMTGRAEPEDLLAVLKTIAESVTH